MYISTCKLCLESSAEWGPAKADRAITSEMDDEQARSQGRICPTGDMIVMVKRGRFLPRCGQSDWKTTFNLIVLLFQAQNEDRKEVLAVTLLGYENTDNDPLAKRHIVVRRSSCQNKTITATLQTKS